MVDLTPVLQALAGLCCALITAVVIPFVRSRVSAERLARARVWADIVVAVAEKLFPQPGSGQEKKAYALDFLSQRSLGLGKGELDVLVECAVCELGHEKSMDKGGGPCCF